MFNRNLFHNRIFPIAEKLKKLVIFGGLLVLPVGIYSGDPDSTGVSVGVGGGFGQYASVIRGCDGPISATKGTYSDVSGSIDVSLPPNQNSPIVVGVRGGYFSAVPYNFYYVNPNFSLEAKHIGIGMGYVSGKRPNDFSEGTFSTDANGKRYLTEKAPEFSGHLRIGNSRRVFFIVSMNENVPLSSGGGFWDLGFGGGDDRGRRFYLGLSVHGIYDSSGLLYQMRLPLKSNFFLTNAVRYGTVEGVDEYGISVGFVQYFGKR